MKTYLPRIPAPARRNRRQRGISLVETMVAMTVTSGLMVSTLSLTTRLAAATDSSNQSTRAYNVARQALENVRTFRGARLADGTYDSTQFGDMSQLPTLGPNSSATVTLSTFRAPVRRVTIAVRWFTSSPNNIRTITLSSLMSPRGVTP